MNALRTSFAFLSLLALCSCVSNRDNITENQDPSQEKLVDLFNSAMNGGEGASGGVISTNSSLKRAEQEINFSELVFTNPDEPDAAIPELDKLFEESLVEDWTSNLPMARAQALSTEKPIIIWFTNSKSSPLCGTLKREVWESKKFKEWSKNNAVLVKFDANLNDNDIGLRSKKQKYIDHLKKQYRAHGFPSVVVLTPDGQFSNREKGYVSGRTDYYFENLKFFCDTANRSFEETKLRLSNQGYRYWNAANGSSKTFAKPLDLLKDDVLLLQKINGSRVRVPLSKLSTEDKNWVQQKVAQKRQRS